MSVRGFTFFANPSLKPVPESRWFRALSDILGFDVSVNDGRIVGVRDRNPFAYLSHHLNDIL